MSSVTKQVDHELIGCCANRIIDMATEIERTHTMGVPHGEHDEPWTLEFHRVVASIYLPIIPARYARGLARSFEQCRILMADGEHPVGADGGDWMIVAEYVGSASRAICEHLRIEQSSSSSGEGVLESTVPGVFPYGKVAPLVSVEGVRRLLQAGSAVQKVCEQAEGTRPSKEDIEIIRMIAKGVKSVDIATASGCSRSSLYRHLKQVWLGLGVKNAREAIYLGDSEGWLEVEEQASRKS